MKGLIIIYKIKYLIVVFLLCIANHCYSDEISLPNQSSQDTWFNYNTVLGGEYFRAILAAFSDFSKKVDPAFSKEKSEKYGQDSLSAQASKLENYYITVAKGNEGYTVTFQFKLSEKHPALLGSGGHTIYIIEPITYKLLKIDRQK